MKVFYTYLGINTYQSTIIKALEENMNENNVIMLEAIYQNIKMGTQSLEELVEICKDEEFKTVLAQQLSDYNVLAKECEMLAKAKKLGIEQNSWMDKTKLWCGIKMKTCKDKTNQNLAEMLIIGSNMGIIDLIKTKSANIQADDDILEIFAKVEDMQERHIQKLKTYL